MDNYQQAELLFEQGKLIAAQNILYSLLWEANNDFKILNFLGVIKLNFKEYESAKTFFEQVVNIFPGHTEAHYNLGFCYQQLKLFKQSIEHYKTAVSLNHNHINAHINLGYIYSEQRDFQKAEESLKSALKISPNSASLLNNLGNIYYRSERYEDSESFYNAAISLQPTNADYYFNLGKAYKKEGRLEMALQNFYSAIENDENNIDSLREIGLIYTRLDEFEKAEDYYSRILKIKNNDVQTYYDLGYCLQLGKHFDRALQFYQKALDIEPDNEKVKFYINNIIQKAGKDQNPELLETKIDDKIKSITFNNIGIARIEQGMIDEAIGYFDHAIELNNEFVEARYNKSHALLLKGDFENGWKEYEWRKKRKEFKSIIQEGPELINQDVSGKRILVYTEQGLGDSIQFVRYLKLLKENNAYVIFGGDLRLKLMFSQYEYIDEFIYKSNDEKIDVNYDYQIALMSLPLYFKTDMSNIPAENVYMKTPVEFLEKWKNLIPQNDELTIGIVWAGSKNHTGDKKRSCKLKDFMPIFSIEGVRVYSLQKGNGLTQINDYGSNLINLDSKIEDFADTAAAINLLDLVITVDTSVAHLAGSLGKPVWLLLPYLPDWRWLLNVTYSLWYPTMKLFRQKKPGDWESVFSKVTKTLEKIISNAKKENHTLGETELYLTGGDEFLFKYDNTIFMGISKGENYGWGQCGKYLHKELSNFIDVISLENYYLRTEKKKITGKVIHGIRDLNFNSDFGIRGSVNISYSFFENELNGNSVKNSRNFDLNLTGSSWCHEKMLNKGIFNSGVLFQGIDPQLFYPGEEKKSDDLFVIFSGGKFELRKGQDLVLKAFKILSQKYKDIILINAWYNFWPATMVSMNVSKHINFELEGNSWDDVMNNIYAINDIDPKKVFTLSVLPNNKLRDIYLKSDVAVFPNRCEGGTNLVLMEYMATGKPVIASNTSGHKDILTDDNSIRLTNLNDFKLYNENNKIIANWEEADLDEIIAAIEYAYFNRDKMRIKGRNAAKDMKNFTWEKTAKQLLNYIEEYS